MGTLISNKDGPVVTASMGMLDIQVTPPNIIQYLYSLHFKFIQYRPLSLVVHFLSKQGMVRIALELYYSNSQVISIITLINRRLYYSIELPYNVGDEKEVGFE